MQLPKINKNLIQNNELKETIVKAENGRYSYFDYDVEIVSEIAKKSIKEVKYKDVRILVQALFPEYLICSGLFDCFLMFRINSDGFRVDPPEYFYADIQSHLNRDSKNGSKRLIEEIIDLFEKNNIKYDDSWKSIIKDEQK